MATEGDDILFYSGQVEQLTITLTNPYSSKSYMIDEEKNVNNVTYDGLGGNDFLYMTDFGDALFLANDVGMQLIHNIEVFVATLGGDIVDLAHETITYGDVWIFGGPGDDILWSNIGNDLVTGADGNDIIDGGPGNDELYGNNDNDQIFGGAGDDYIEGGSGNDILYGGTDLGLIDLDKDFVDSITFPDLQSHVNITKLVPPGTPSLGINSDNLSVSYDATATITFRQGHAGYNNTLGIYAIAADGTISTTKVLWANVKDAGYGIDHLIDLPVGESGGQFGFFIIANGDRKNNGYKDLDITGDGVVNFVYDYGGASERAATIHDDGTMVSAVYDDGVTIKVLNGFDYHTTARGESADINWDGEIHAVSGLADPSNPGVLRIGFEDLPNLGDADFEDVLFDLNIDRIHMDASELGNDTLVGGAGDDILYGEAGDDLLIVGEGRDEIYGGTGNDTIQYDFLDSLVDTIYGFETGAGHDVLDISAILDGFDPVGDVLANFVQLTDNGGNTEVHVNADGDIGGAFTQIALIDGGLNDTLENLINNGNIVV